MFPPLFSIYCAKPCSEDGAWHSTVFDIINNDHEIVSHAWGHFILDPARDGALHVHLDDLLEFHSTFERPEMNACQLVIVDYIAAYLWLVSSDLLLIATARIEDKLKAIIVLMTVKGKDRASVRDKHGHGHLHQEHLVSIVIGQHNSSQLIVGG